MRFTAVVVVGLALILPAPLALAKHLPPPATPITVPAPSPLLMYQPKERDFSIGFPGAPKTSFRMLMDGRERVYMDNEGDRLFMVTATSFLFGAKTDQAAYDRRLKRFGENADATLVSSQRLIWGGEQGCEGVFTTAQGNLVLVRLLVHEKRLYQAVFWGRGGAGGQDAEEGGAFLESFRLGSR